MNTTKIVFIGAGSMSFGLSMFRDLFNSKELYGSTLVLVDINQDNLERMSALAHLMNDKYGAGIHIESTTERRKALPGAGFVVNSTVIERNRLWKLDFDIPRKYGIRHTLGENGGPGGLFFTMRTLPMIYDITQDMEELCPDAIFINFSNPESRIILMVNKYTKIRAIGLCHGVFMSRSDVASILGMKPAEVDVWAAGLNHFQWLLEIRHHQTGEDLYPLLRECEKNYNPAFLPLTRQLFNAFGKWPTCSDDHLGEYLAYGWEAGEEGYDFDLDEKNRIMLQTTIQAILNGQEIPPDWAKPSGESGVDVISGILHNKKTILPAGIIYNQGTISSLPADLAVEVPVMVDSSGIHPFHIGALPDGINRLLLAQAGVQQLAVEAAVHGSKDLVLQSQLIDPVINSSQAAQHILDELWEYNRSYIRACID